jgi:DNA-binding beta-propeller fold protein YncE
MGARGFLLRGLVGLGLSVAVFAFGVAPALAVEFGGEGAEAGQFESPSGVAVNQSNGDMYVVDRNNARVEKFTKQGAFLLAWGWGVADHETQAPQTCTVTCYRAIEGSGAGQFSSPEGVAIDNDLLSSSRGDVYVIDKGNDRVEKFGPEGEFLLMWGGEVNGTTKGDVCVAGEVCQGGKEGTGQGEFESLGEEGAIAVGADGTVYVGDRERVQVFSPTGVYQSTITVPGALSVVAVAVDPSGHVYLTTEQPGGYAKPEVAEYSSTGVLVRTIALPVAQLNQIRLATDASGHLFVDDDQEPIQSVFEYGSSGEVLVSFPPPGGEAEQLHGIGLFESAGVADEVVVVGASTVRTEPVAPVGRPLVETQEANPEPAAVATLKGVIDPEGKQTKYHFEYGLEPSKETATATVTMVAEEFTPETVETKVTGLKPGRIYHYHVVAEDSEHHLSEGPDATFNAFPAASVESLSVSDVTATTVRLEAEINPLDTSTTYQFEYGTGTTRAFTPEVDIGAGSTGVAVSVPVQGLVPGSVYDYRVIAKNALGSVEASSEFTSQPPGSGFTLPDGREWEMVSPAENHGTQVDGQYEEGAVMQASSLGNAIAYITASPTEAEPKGYDNLQQVLAARGPEGWGSHDIGIPHEKATRPSVGNGEEYRFFSEDLSLAAIQPFGTFDRLLSAEASEPTSYLRTNYLNGDVGDPCASCYHPYVTGAPGYANVPAGTAFGGETEGICRGQGGGLLCGPEFVGGTPDLSHAVLRSKVALTSVPAPEGGLYEWGSGKLTLISRLPGSGGEAASGSRFGQEEVSIRRAISNDGSRVFWSTNEHLYMRDTTKEKTVQLDAVQGGSGEYEERPHFQIASSDGSKVFFTDEQRLIKGSGSQRGAPDLYECEIVEEAGGPRCNLSDLTPKISGKSANVQGEVLGASEDGSWVYFVANGAFVPGAVQGSCQEFGSAEESCNLYVRHEGVTSLVAVVSEADSPDWSTSLVRMTSRVSPDGQWLAFQSQRELTGYDTRDAVSGQRDEEVYLYKAGAADGAGRVVCASCDTTGARPVGAENGQGFTLFDGDGVWSQSSWLAANVPGWTPYSLGRSLYQSRYLSDSGRLLFNSHDALVPQDVNGTWDVYEYEPPEVGDCTSLDVRFSKSAEGCVGLISSGAALEESAFLDASETGGDVFFLTSAQLSSADQGTTIDIYDAHECSAGAPCFAAPPVTPPVCDTGDSCKAAPSPQPAIFGSPASSTFTGSGNVTGTAPEHAVAQKTLTRAQKLARALKACKRKKGKRRAACIRQAKARYAHKSSKANAIKRGRR